MKVWDGLMECQTFWDFFEYANSQPKEKFKCPECESQMDYRTFTSFNMLKSGAMIFSCPNHKCRFYLDPIKIEAINYKR